MGLVLAMEGSLQMAFRPFRRNLTPIGRGGVIRQEGKGGVQTSMANRGAVTGNPIGSDYTKPPMMPNRPAPYTGPFTQTPPFQQGPAPARPYGGGVSVPALPSTANAPYTAPAALGGSTDQSTATSPAGTSPTDESSGGGVMSKPGNDDYTA